MRGIEGCSLSGLRDGVGERSSRHPQAQGAGMTAIRRAIVPSTLTDTYHPVSLPAEPWHMGDLISRKQRALTRGEQSQKRREEALQALRQCGGWVTLQELASLIDGATIDRLRDDLLHWRARGLAKSRIRGGTSGGRAEWRAKG